MKNFKKKYEREESFFEEERDMLEWLRLKTEEFNNFLKNEKIGKWSEFNNILENGFYELINI